MDISALPTLAHLPSLPLTDKKHFPHVTAVYLVLDATQRPLYIGSTLNLRYRWRKHAYRAYLLAQPGIVVAWLSCQDEERFTLEQQMIALYHPPLNSTISPFQARQATLVARTCPQCGGLFHTYPQKPHIFCSMGCRDASKGVTWVEMTCLLCHHPFSIERSRAKKGEARFCSSACLQASRQQFSSVFIAKFWARVARCTHEEWCPYCCWLWQGKLRGAGYGVVVVEGKEKLAHRVSWEMQHGLRLPPFTYDKLIRHLCHTPGCVNPWHVAIGTAQQNAKDTVTVKRHHHGSTHTYAKLTEEKVQHIRTLRRQGLTWLALATMFGVTKMAVFNACTRKTWKHVP